MVAMALQTVGTTVRDLSAEDWSAVLRIDKESYGASLSEDQWFDRLKGYGSQMVVIERGDAIEGYMLFQERKRSVVIERMAVRRKQCGYGRLLVNVLVKRLVASGRERADVVVSEMNVEAQLFLGAVGFRAVQVMRKAFGERDGYLFRRIVGEMSG